MALAATVFKADVDISDVDRNHYRHYAVTLARHPSETSERMMVRLLAYLHHADERLIFTKGLSATSEPDLWQKDMTGDIRLWVEVGLPDAKRILRACGRSREVIIYGYGRNALQWLAQIGRDISRARNLTVYVLPVPVTDVLASLTGRSMKIQCTIQDSQMYISKDMSVLHVDMGDCLKKKAEYHLEK